MNPPPLCTIQHLEIGDTLLLCAIGGFAAFGLILASMAGAVVLRFAICKIAAYRESRLQRLNPHWRPHGKA